MNDFTRLFKYTVINESTIIINKSIIQVIEKVLNKWNSIIINNPTGRIIDIDLYFKPIDGNGILGYATPLFVIGSSFGNIFSTKCKIVLNTNIIFSFNENYIYNVILHEFGHALGIGVFWYQDNSPINSFKEDNNLFKKYYIGPNALREYRRILNNKGIVGIPVEDNGLEGTVDYHIEEGSKFSFGKEITKNNRYVNGILHHGLQNELMTGWADNDAVLSRITVGLLEDIGYGVDYSQADYFNPLNLELEVLEKETLWNLPHYNNYSIENFYNKIGFKYNNDYNFSKIKILIIDTAFNKNKIKNLGYNIDYYHYKNFTGYTNGNDMVHGTNVFLTISSICPNAEYYFAESEWTPNETINEIDNLINSLKWGQELNVDLINISIGYSFEGDIFREKKEELEELINNMTNTIITVSVNNQMNTNLHLPSDIENTVTVGNARGNHNYKINSKPDLVLPNINNLTGDEFWDNTPHTSKCSAIMCSIFAICMIERPTISKNDLKNKIYETSSELDTRSIIYGYGIPLLGNFLETTKNYTTNESYIPLRKGWNLISFPFTNIKIQDIIDNNDIIEIKNIDYSYNRNIPNEFNSLTEISSSSSYWIYCGQETNLSISGEKIYQIILHLKKGWNMISCPFIEKIYLSEIMTPEIIEIKNIYNSYNYTIPEFSTLKYLEPFQGYYLKASQDFNLTLFN